jgi:hypothetical protein
MLGIFFLFSSKPVKIRNFGNLLIIFFEAAWIDPGNGEDEAPAQPLSGGSFFQVTRRHRYATS